MIELPMNTAAEPTRSSKQRIELVRRIADEVSAQAADVVDRDARFPHESIGALKQEHMLSLLVPIELGGASASVAELFAMCEVLGSRCAASSMIFGMHQIQVACLVRHGQRSPHMRAYLRQLVAEQRLIASVTSEAGVGGSVRTSISPIERDGPRCRLRKDGTVVSYGEQADDLLITVRRAPDAPSSDQALVLVPRNDCTMERTGSWDTLGMRGTCSPGYILTATFDEQAIVPDAFAEISSKTMLPLAHLLWTGTWLGIASDAVARARAYVRSVARQIVGTTPPAAARLAEVILKLQMMRSHAHDLVHRFDAMCASQDGGREEMSTVGFAIAMNNLKVASSRMVVDIVIDAMRICGSAAYRNDTRYSMTRHLRDACSAAVMIGNDRILSTNATLALASRRDAFEDL
ncbi:MAG: acyl-CoA dehydrogenase [Myxococcaceae bacterium]|nr:acyl-CoA dehydrogenase [Myxococcaceae bacterium]